MSDDTPSPRTEVTEEQKPEAFPWGHIPGHEKRIYKGQKDENGKVLEDRTVLVPVEML